MLETQPAVDRIESRAGAAATLLGIAVGFAALNLLAIVILVSSGGPSILVAWFIGGMAVQPVLIGLWAALGSGSYLMRLPQLAAVATAVVLSAAVPISRIDPPETDLSQPAAGLGALFAAIFAASALLGLFLRWWTRQSVQYSIASAGTEPHRFSIRYLLGLTTLCAVLAAIVGRVFSNGLALPTDDLPMVLFTGVTAAGFGFAICVPTVFIPWVILSPLPRGPLMGVGTAFWLLWTVTLIALVSRLTGGRRDVPFELLIGAQIGAALVSAATASALRAAGFRLVFRTEALTLNE